MVKQGLISLFSEMADHSNYTPGRMRTFAPLWPVALLSDDECASFKSCKMYNKIKVMHLDNFFYLKDKQ